MRLNLAPSISPRRDRPALFYSCYYIRGRISPSASCSLAHARWPKGISSWHMLSDIGNGSSYPSWHTVFTRACQSGSGTRHGCLDIPSARDPGLHIWLWRTTAFSHTENGLFPPPHIFLLTSCLKSVCSSLHLRTRRVNGNARGNTDWSN